MKLTLLERFLLMNLLPQRESIDIIRIVTDLRHNLAPSEEEFKECEIESNDGLIKFNKNGFIEKEIAIGEKATDICKKVLIEADQQKVLTEQHLTLYDKFVK